MSYLLSTQDFSLSLSHSISNARSEVCLLSAFIKRDALEILLKDMEFEPAIQVVARWRKSDLLVGASDLAVYEYCRERGWKFGVDQNFHGKLYYIDNEDIFLGSANLTQRGLMLAGFGNHEFGVKIQAANADGNKIDNFLSREVTWLNDELYEKLKAEVGASKAEMEPFKEASWSVEIRNIIDKPVEFLWVYELSYKEPKELLHLDLNDESSVHDFELLNLNIDNLGETNLRQGFKQTRLFYWITAQLKENESMNFGAISHALHNSLLDDPAPYRKKVKEFVVILFAWFEFLNDDFELTKYNVTTSVRLKE